MGGSADDGNHVNHVFGVCYDYFKPGGVSAPLIPASLCPVQVTEIRTGSGLGEGLSSRRCGFGLGLLMSDPARRQPHFLSPLTLVQKGGQWGASNGTVTCQLGEGLIAALH